MACPWALHSARENTRAPLGGDLPLEAGGSFLGLSVELLREPDGRREGDSSAVFEALSGVKTLPHLRPVRRRRPALSVSPTPAPAAQRPGHWSRWFPAWLAWR